MEEQQQKQTKKVNHYIVEHMDDGLFDWSNAEYTQMTKYLKTEENKDQKKHRLIISNTKTFLSQANENNENEKYQKNADELMKNNITFPENKLYTYIDDQGNFKFEDLEIKKERICLLDMRGDAELAPEDSEQFDCFLFGGILGDHPPKDRTKALRDKGFKMKRLGAIQLATDTAVLISKLILEQGYKFEEIPYVDEPTFQNKQDEFESITMDGFRYVSQQYDIEKETLDLENKEKRNQPLLNPKIGDDLMFLPIDLGEPL